MSKLTWEDVNDRHYAFGVDRGVFYNSNGIGQTWNGLVSVEELSADTDPRVRYFDGVKISNRLPRDAFEATLEAFTYPETFGDIIKTRNKTLFGLSYRTMTDKGYKIHLVYNILATSSDRNFVYETPSLFTWSLTTHNPSGLTAHLIIDTETAYSETVEALETLLYGNESFDARLPTQTEVLQIFEDNSILQIIDHGDGTWTAIGPADVIVMINATTFEITWPSAIFTGSDTYTLSSL